LLVVTDVAGERFEGRAAERKVRTSFRRRTEPSDDLTVEPKSRKPVTDAFLGVRNDGSDGLPKALERATLLSVFDRRKITVDRL
jgi:hypothetical protein